MDRESKSKAHRESGDLLPGIPAPASPAIDWSIYTKPQHLCEGTESDDDEVITSQRPSVATLKTTIFKAEADLAFPPVDSRAYQAKAGELSKPGESFCVWQTIKKYPYCYIGNANRDRVASRFFDNGQLESRNWDFFYLYRSSAVDTQNLTHLILVPTKQFVDFLQTINRYYHTELKLPFRGENGSFEVTFEDDGTPRPRYLGQASSKATSEKLKARVPPSYYKLDGEPDAVGKVSDRSLMAFKAKVDLMSQSQKGKKATNKEKQKLERINKQQEWSHSIKRVQRYLGLRQVSQDIQLTAIKEGLQNSGIGWGDYDAAVQAAAAKLYKPATFDPYRPAPYDPEGSVIFVCADVEAYERNLNQITEIGIATLDSEDLKGVVPGKGGENWLGLIRARHFRINQYKHLQNKDFVAGCADRFEFGDSEFIDLKDAPRMVANCFKPPFSKPGAEAPTIIDPNLPKRSIVLVGHDLGADIAFLKKIGYDVYNLSNLLETADTASMWRYVKRDINPRNLGSILAELDITGWNLHNAGNDAAYTLQAMIKIAIKHLQDKVKAPSAKEQEIKDRIAESVKEATVAAWEREQGWSSSGENSDGGIPTAPATKVATMSKKAPQSQRRNPEMSSWSQYHSPQIPSSQQATPHHKQNTPADNVTYTKSKPTSWEGGSVPPHMRHMQQNTKEDDVHLAELVMKTKLEDEKPKVAKGWGMKPMSPENQSSWEAWK